MFLRALLILALAVLGGCQTAPDNRPPPVEYAKPLGYVPPTAPRDYPPYRGIWAHVDARDLSAAFNGTHSPDATHVGFIETASFPSEHTLCVETVFGVCHPLQVLGRVVSSVAVFVVDVRQTARIWAELGRYDAMPILANSVATTIGVNAEAIVTVCGRRWFDYSATESPWKSTGADCRSREASNTSEIADLIDAAGQHRGGFPYFVFHTSFLGSSVFCKWQPEDDPAFGSYPSHADNLRANKGVSQA